MCLIGFVINRGPSLLIAANRDEFSKRPTAPMHWWSNGILAGKDLRAGGTWLGVSRSGRFAAVTNVRDPGLSAASVPMGSRGQLVHAYLSGSSSPKDFAFEILESLSSASPFNLIVGSVGDDAIDCWWLGGRTQEISPMANGVHVLSNAELNTPWPKSVRLRDALHSGSLKAIEDMMQSQEIAEDGELPSTGVPYGLEKKLSAALITGAEYHTRSSTFIQISEKQGIAREITWSPDAKPLATVQERFTISGPSVSL